MELDRFDPRLRECLLSYEAVDDAIRIARDASLHLDDGGSITAAREMRQGDKRPKSRDSFYYATFAHIYVYNSIMWKSGNIRELEYLASSQWGMFTTAQAGTLGVGRTQVSRMAANGTIEQVRRGVYRYAVGEETPHVYAKAAWLACYPRLTAAERLRTRPHDAVVACNTAASLHGIGDLHEDPYTFIVRTRRQTTAGDLSFHIWKLDERDLTYVDTLPVTSMERTVADLVRERRDPDHVALAARAAHLKGLDSERLRQLLDGLSPSYDTTTVLAAVTDVLSTTNEAVVQGIVSEVMAELGRRAQGNEPGAHDLSPMEQAFAEIVRRRLRPILEERAAEIERRHSEDVAVRPADNSGVIPIGSGRRRNDQSGRPTEDHA